jgi:hypothetical protein
LTTSLPAGVFGLHTGGRDRLSRANKSKAGQETGNMSKPRESRLRRMLVCGTVSASFVLYAGAASADMAAAKKWVDEEFQPSTLSEEQQMKEMEWFITRPSPLRA